MADDRGSTTARRRRKRLGLALALLLLVLALPWLLRDALAARLLRSSLLSRLAEAGWQAAIDEVDVRVPADLSVADVRLRGLRLRATADGTWLEQAELDEVRAPLPLRALLLETGVGGPWDVAGARLQLDLRGGGQPGGSFPWPGTLPVARVRGLQARGLLADGLALELHDATLTLAEPAEAPALQSLELDGALRLQAGGGDRDLGRLQAGLGWRAGVIAVTERMELHLPEGESLRLLDGSRLDLASDAGQLAIELHGELVGGTALVAGRLQRGGRFVGEIEGRELQLDRLAALAGAAGLQPVELTASGTLDVPLRPEGLHAALASARADLEISLRRPGTDDEVALGGLLADGVIELSRGLAQTRGGSLLLSAGRLELGADWLDTRLELAGRADVEDLQPLGALLAPLLAAVPGDVLPAGDWGGSLSGHVEAAGTARDPAFRLDVAGEDVEVAGWRVGDLSLAATGDRRLVRVERGELRSPGGQIELHGTLDVVARSLEDVIVEALLDVRATEGEPPSEVLSALARRWLPRDAGEVTLRVAAEGPLDEPRFELAATLQDARLAAAGRLASPPWLGASGAATAVHVLALQLDRGELGLQLQQPAVLSFGDCLELTPLELQGSAGAARLAFTNEGIADDRRRHELVAAAAGLSPALLPASLRPAGVLADVLELDLRLAWTSAAGSLPAAACDALSDPRDLDLHLAVELGQPALDEPGLLGSRLVVRCDLAGDPSRPRGRVDVDADDLQLALPAALARALEALEGGGEVEVDRPDPSEGGRLVDASGRVRGVSPVAAGAGPRQLGPCTLALRLACGDTLALEVLRLAGAEALSVEASGRLGAPLDLAAAAAGGAVVRGDAPLQLEGRLASIDVAHVRGWLGGVRRLSGRLDAEVAVTGTLDEPVVTGRAGLLDGELRLASGIPPLEALQAEVELDPHEARVVRCTGELGAMPFELTGHVRTEGGDEALDLRLTGSNLLVWRGQGIKVRADVDLALQGPLEAPLARGWLRLRDSRVVRAVDALQLARVVPAAPDGALSDVLRESPLARLRLDVAVSAAEPVLIENNILRGELVPDLRLLGTGEAPVPEGELHLLSTRLALPASILHITHGRLLFDAADPRHPSIDLHGETSVRGYTITVDASGAWDEPVLELVSSPPLPSEEVLLLVLTGQPPNGAGTAGLAAGGVTGVYLGQDLLARWLTDTASDDDSVLDRFEFGYAEDVTTHGSTLVQVSYHMIGDLQAGRPALYLHAEKDPYDAVNFGLRWRVRLR